MKAIRVRAPSRPYAVLYGRGLLRQLASRVRSLGNHSGLFLLSSPRVWKHWGRKIEAASRSSDRCRVILFDDREAAKKLSTVERICRRLSQAGADRDAVIVAVGGGVVGDVAGFVAASYLRGVRLVHVPTTLVAQVDSAIGGKTGVNLREGKNLIGAFYQPSLVLADPDSLATLPQRQYRSGLYEVVKYAVIGDAQLLRHLENHSEDLLGRRPAALDFVIPRCIAAKARIVSRDERETAGLRETLNFGHTFAHALETVTRYRRFLHGEAVGWGMLAATGLAARHCGLGAQDAERIRCSIRSLGPLPPLPRIPAARLLAVMRRDKKSRRGRLRLILPCRIGSVRIVESVPGRVAVDAWSSLFTIH